MTIGMKCTAHISTLLEEFSLPRSTGEATLVRIANKDVLYYELCVSL